MSQKINVNTTPGQFMPTLHYSQGDIGREFQIALLSSDGWSIPAGATVEMVATKPSGFGFTVSGTLSDNTATFVTTETMTNEWGRFPAEVRISSSGDVIGTANFYLSGERDPHPEETIDGDAEEIIPELTLLVERVEAAASSILDMTVVADTLPAGSDATYSYDEETNTATFGIPKGADGSLASGVLAPTYSSSSTYAVGDYVYYSGNLYRCTTAITTAEAWTSGHWTQVALAPEVTDVKSAIDQTIRKAQKHCTAFVYSAFYNVPYNFIAWRTYRITIKLDTPYANYTTVWTNISTCKAKWVSTHASSDIVEPITGSTDISVSVIDEINLTYTCATNSEGLAYYLGSGLKPHTVTIEDITDESIGYKYKSVPITANKTAGNYSILLKANVPYLLSVNNSSSTVGLKFEFTGADAQTFTTTERFYGGVVAPSTSGVFKFTPSNDWDFVLTNALDANLSISLYYDIEVYNSLYNEKPSLLNLLGSKHISAGVDQDASGYLYAITNVNFEKGEKYIIRVQTLANESIKLSGLAFGSFNGDISNRTMVDETITNISGVAIGKDYCYLYEPSGDATNFLIHAYNSAHNLISVSVYEYKRNEQNFYDYYVNPVFKKRDTSDPTIWDGHDGYYYCMGSPWEVTSYGLLRSADLIEWENTGVFPFDSSVTDLLSHYTKGIWAPQCVYLDGQYLMYISLYNSLTDNCVAVCKSRTPFGKFSFVKILTDSTATDIKDSIDPTVVIGEDNKTYLFFGSTGGIYRLQLTDDGLDVASGATPIHVAGTTDTGSQRIKAFEGTYLYYRNGYWYMFVSSGEFNNNSYAIRVGRSASISGTFTDKNGDPMTEGYAETITVTASDAVFNGAGHNSEIIVDKTGRTYMMYHCHDVASQYNVSSPLGTIKSRMLFLQELLWDADGFPYFENSAPINIASPPIL